MRCVTSTNERVTAVGLPTLEHHRACFVVWNMRRFAPLRYHVSTGLSESSALQAPQTGMAGIC